MAPRDTSVPDIPIDATIEERIDAAVTRYGAEEVVDRAIALLGGANAGEDFLLYVGGRHALGIVEGAPALYWPELWGARALLWVWSDRAATAVAGGLGNQAWRVREMACRVVQRRALEVAPQLVALLSDEVSRVRAAAARALGAVGGAEHRAGIEALLRDPDKETRRAAQESRDALDARLAP